MSAFKRLRSAITGRFVTRRHAERNQSTTVSETVRPPAAPGPDRCYTPNGVCASPERCKHYGGCTWETWRAADPPRPGAV